MSKKSHKLSDFKPTKRNSNKHTPRGLHQLDSSMAEVGYTSPMTAAADGEIIDGDARLETSFSRFGDDVITIEHDGTKPIIAIRTDLPNANDPIARQIHYQSNRVSETNLDWDAGVIIDDLDLGLDLSSLFFDNELEEIAEQAVFEDETAKGLASDRESPRDLGDKNKKIKPVLYAEDIADFEQAIKLTGNRNRGKAVIEICKAYIESKTKGQFGIQTESDLEIDGIGDFDL